MCTAMYASHARLKLGAKLLTPVELHPIRSAMAWPLSLMRTPAQSISRCTHFSAIGQFLSDLVRGQSAYSGRVAPNPVGDGVAAVAHEDTGPEHKPLYALLRDRPIPLRCVAVAGRLRLGLAGGRSEQLREDRLGTVGVVENPFQSLEDQFPRLWH